jgi:excisionase family DNA binding protein
VPDLASAPTAGPGSTAPAAVTGPPEKAVRSIPGLSESLGQVRFLTVAEVATVMRVSKMTVYRLVHGGDLPAVRVGRSFRVPEQAVHDYLRNAYIEAG